MATNRKKPEKAYKNLQFLTSPEARPIRILAEFTEPSVRFRKFGIHSTVVFFGSARVRPHDVAKKELKVIADAYEEHPSEELEKELSAARLRLRLSKYYEDATELARLLTEWAIEKGNGKQALYVCTGGGPGIMEAANKGAYLAGGKSIGLNISLPHEQEPNPYISEELGFEFHYFFMRKYWLVYLAKALIIFPGGFGTLDELMEVLTLLQTGKIHRPLPIVVFGQDYWQEIIDFEAMARWGTIAFNDLNFFKFVNSAEEGFHYLKKHLEKWVTSDLDPENEVRFSR
ncbi:LOG family protein [Caldithrix abyssi]